MTLEARAFDESVLRDLTEMRALRPSTWKNQNISRAVNEYLH